MNPILEILSDCLLGVLTGAALVMIALVVHAIENILENSGVDYE